MVQDYFGHTKKNERDDRSEMIDGDSYGQAAEEVIQGDGGIV